VVKKSILEEKMIKKLVLFCCFLLIANMLFASARIERKIEKTDLSIIPQSGESEIFFDLQGGGSVYIYVDRQFVAQCYPIAEDDLENDYLEKIVVKNGRHTIEVVAVTAGSSNTGYRDTVTDRKSLDCNVESESVTVEIDLNLANDDFKITKLFYANRRSINQDADSNQRIADSQQRVTVAIAPFEEKSGITKSDADAVTEIFTAELLASNSVRIVTRANLDKIMSEMEFQMGDWSNDEKTAKLGEAVNAHWVIRGQVTKLGRRIIVTAHGLDVNTLEMTSSARMQLNNIEDAYDQMEPFVNGMVQTMTNR
jgi:TolB-like protein